MICWSLYLFRLATSSLSFLYERFCRLLIFLSSGIGGALFVSFLTTESFSLNNEFIYFLLNYRVYFIWTLFVLVILTTFSKLSYQHHLALAAFRTVKKGKCLSSPNEIASTPRQNFAEAESDDSEGRPVTEYVSLSAIEWNNHKHPGTDRGETYTDLDIANLLREEKDVLIIGIPTAGKTRKSYEILKREIGDRYVLVPDREILENDFHQRLKDFFQGKK